MVFTSPDHKAGYFWGGVRERRGPRLTSHKCETAIKNAVEVDSLSLYLQGFIHPNGGDRAGFPPSTVWEVKIGA